MEQKEICKRTLEYLKERYPNPNCELEFNTPFQMLVSVILSAQCTDARVNQVTKILFKDFGTPEQLAKANQQEIERIIYSCGLYHNKAKNIIACSKDICERFDGQVPSSLEDMQTLAGVGRKTANVVYSLAFGGDAIAVDTHVFRTANRLKIGEGKTPEQVEKELMKNFDKSEWSKLHYRLVLFGRYHCKSQKPNCSDCGIKDICSYFAEKNK